MVLHKTFRNFSNGTRSSGLYIGIKFRIKLNRYYVGVVRAT